LEHEAELIRKQGLRPFSGELFDDRIDAALQHGHLTTAEHGQLRASHMVAGGETHSRGDRLGKVCLLVGTDSLEDDGLHPLMTSWGGEGIYFAAGTVDMRSRLRQLGTPTVVVAAVPVLPTWWEMPIRPGTAHLLLGRWRNLSNARGSLQYRTAVSAENILEVWQPGHPEYDRHPLPR
jgi:hypothetical protein